MDVVMTRKTGRLTFNITDTAPENVGKVTILVYYSRRYRLSTGTVSAATTSTQYSKDLAIDGGVLEPFEFNCFQSNGVVVELSIYDADNTLLDSRSLNISIYENRKTIITGELFSNVSGKEFTVTVSDDWGADNIVDL